MSAINETVTAWWPVLVGVWGLISTAITLYAKSISGQLTTLRTAHDALAAQFNDYKVEVAKTYMPSVDIKELVADLKQYLVRIEDKIEDKK